MPTVPGGEEEEGMTSLASQRPKPRMQSIRPGDMSFPIGQVASGAYGKQTWRQYRSLREEIIKQTDVAQQPYPNIAAGIGAKVGPGWERMIKEGPKSKNIEVEKGGLSLDPTETERMFIKSDAARAEKKWMKTGPTPTGPTQPSMKSIATQNMGLNEQEQNLYQHHLDNLEKGGVKSKEGKTSTLLAITRNIDGKEYVIPTVWNNKIVSGEQATQNALDKGIDKFPSYDSRLEAMSRYQQMHDYMDVDVK